MFWEKSKEAREVAVSEIAVPTVSNADSVRQLAIPILNYDCRDLKHQYEVQRVTGADINDPVAVFYDKLRTELFDAEFRWFVTADFISKFRYCADLAIGRSGCCTNRVWPYASRVSYIGDIPDTVLDRLDVARKILHYFTVHSNQPLKVARFERVDPVLIGWYDDPAIVVDDKNTFTRCSKYCLGVVIAIWDVNKEVEILEG